MLRPGDGAAVRELVLAGLAEHWGSLDPSLNEDLDDLAASHPGSRTLVIDDGGRIVATGTVVPRSEGECELVRVGVASTHRSLGLGRTIVEALLEVGWTMGADRVICETTSAWYGVVEFWQACGFSITHLSPSPFGSDGCNGSGRRSKTMA